MSLRPCVAVLTLAALALAGPGPASAAAIDGVLDPEYGPPLALQTTQSTLAPSGPGSVDYCGGEELDGAYGYIADGTLYLFLSGNLSLWWTLEGTTEWEPVDLFIDSHPGGQNQLLANNPTIDSYFYDAKQMAGLTFDPGFEADYWLSLGSNNYGYPQLYAYSADLPTAGGGSGALLGTTLCGGPGVLSGGANPYGIRVTVNDLNTAGVTLGCGSASGAGVSTGIEWAIPLAALGDPQGCIKVCAFVSIQTHARLFNQVLGPLPPGTCDLGAASAVNFAQIAGDQFFTVCPGSVPTERTSWGRVKATYR